MSYFVSCQPPNPSIFLHVPYCQSFNLYMLYVILQFMIQHIAYWSIIFVKYFYIQVITYRFILLEVFFSSFKVNIYRQWATQLLVIFLNSGESIDTLSENPLSKHLFYECRYPCDTNRITLHTLSMKGSRCPSHRQFVKLLE